MEKEVMDLLELNEKERDTPNYFAIIPAEVRYDNRLNANAKLLYGEITALTGKNGLCWASDVYFMDLYEVSRSTLQRWLKNLEEFGYLKRLVVYKKDTKMIEKRYMKVFSNLGQGYTQKWDNPMPKNETVSITRTNNTSIKDIESNIVSNIDIVETPKLTSEISLSICNDIGLDLEIDLKVVEKFYHYFSVRNWTTKDNLKIDLNNLKNHIQLWALREFEQQAKTNPSTAKENKPGWLNEYMQEIASMN